MLSGCAHSDNSVCHESAFVRMENKAALFLRTICSLSRAFSSGMRDASYRCCTVALQQDEKCTAEESTNVLSGILIAISQQHQCFLKYSCSVLGLNAGVKFMLGLNSEQEQVRGDPLGAVNSVLMCSATVYRLRPCFKVCRGNRPTASISQASSLTCAAIMAPLAPQLAASARRFSVPLLAERNLPSVISGPRSRAQEVTRSPVSS